MEKVNIPTEVIEFANEFGYKTGLEFVMNWNNYEVYMPDYSSVAGTVFGMPQFILKKDNIIKWADNEEQGKIMISSDNKN